MAQVRQRANSPFFCLFVLVEPSGDWMMFALTEKGDVLSVT